MTDQFHEDFRREGGEPRASERSFGLVFTGAFALIGLLPLLNSHPIRWWALGVAVLFAALAFLAPRLLAPLNRVWTLIGKLLHRVVSPLALGLLYAIAVVPTGWFLRARGLDPLRLKYDPAAQTYWVTRRNAEAVSFKNQF